MERCLLVCSVIVLFQSILGQTIFPSSVDRCQTPDNRNGQCVIIYSCPPILQLLQNRPFPVPTLTFLRQSQCGYVGRRPKVCCPVDETDIGNEPVTPDTSQNDDDSLTNHPNAKLIPSSLTCGGITEKIFDGEEAKVDEFPWMALLQYRDLRTNRKPFLCGGSLINERYVLTAGHCLIVNGFRLINVRLGEHNTETEVDCQANVYNAGEETCNDPPLDVPVEEIITHPEFSIRSKNQHNDIGLVRLGRRVRITDFIKPICLPLTVSSRRASSKVWVAGWGKTETGRDSPVKLKTSLPVVGNEECKSIYVNRKSIATSQICAGGGEKADSCNGDSGGPLMGAQSDDDADFFEIIGIVSFGPTPCARKGWPGVYTRVSDFTKWILDEIKP